MLYYLNRFILLAVIIFIFVLLKKFKIIKSKKWTCIIAGCTAVLIFVIFSFCENCFLRFSTPEAAFDYSNVNCALYKTVINQDTAVIAYSRGKNSADYALFVKDKSGWMIDTPGFTDEKCDIYKHYGITTYKLSYKRKELITVTNNVFGTGKNRIMSIHDSHNSNFMKIQMDMYGDSNATDYTIIDYPTKKYYMYIDGDKIDMRNLI